VIPPARSVGVLVLAGILVGCVTEEVHREPGEGGLQRWVVQGDGGPKIFDAQGNAVAVQPGAPVPEPPFGAPLAPATGAGAAASRPTGGVPPATRTAPGVAMPVPLRPLRAADAGTPAAAARGPAAATPSGAPQPSATPSQDVSAAPDDAREPPAGAFGEPPPERRFGFATPFGVFEDEPVDRPERLGSGGGLLGLLPSTDVTEDDSLLGLISPATERDAVSSSDLLELIEPATPSDVEPDVLGGPPSPFHRLGRNVVRGVDGTWSKLYVLRQGRSAAVIGLLQGHVPGFPAEPGVAVPADAPVTEQVSYVLHPNFYADETETIGVRQQIKGANIADMLVVTAPPETLVFIDELLSKVLADVAQVELAVRVVEVNLDDTIDWDSQLRLLRLEDGALPFDPETNPIDGKFGSGIPITDASGDPTGVGGIFNSLASLPTTGVQGFVASLLAKYGDVRIESIISLLQTIGAAKLISSPTVTVLNGHHATLSTGDQVPVFVATGVNENPTISTEFKDTGVQIDIVPFIVGEDVVRIDLAIDVSSVTSTVDFVVSGVAVNNPVISQRDAGSTVLVTSGQTFSIGGLIASEDIETITKVPFLGDLPLLGWFFKSRQSIRTNTEIVFFITPRIIYPSESLLDPLAF